MTLSSEIFGLPIPDAGPVFATALVIHILCGLTAVIAGALAATARKRPGRHPRAGRVYLWALGGIFTTATIMAIIRSCPFGIGSPISPTGSCPASSAFHSSGLRYGASRRHGGLDGPAGKC